MSFRVSTYKNVSSACRNKFTSFFLVWMAFTSFTCLITLAWTCSIMLNKMVRVVTLILFLILKKKFSIFSIECVCCGLVKYGFYFVRYNPCMPTRCTRYTSLFLDFLLWKDGEFSQMVFLNYWDDHIIFIFHSISVMYHICWFICVEPSLHPSENSHFIMVYDPFNMLPNSVC